MFSGKSFENQRPTGTLPRRVGAGGRLTQSSETGRFPAGRLAAADVGLRTGATALVTFNDLMAIGVLRRLRRRGVDVPGSVSVVGYDNIFGADFCQPALTTVAGSPELAGRMLVDLALGRIDGRTDTPICIATQRLVRDSTSAVRC